MIKIENVEVHGWEAAIRGMRNPMNSWERSDSSCFGCMDSGEKRFRDCETCDEYIGPNDRDLMMRLARAGSEHAKYRRMIVCSFDCVAPLYLLKEIDTYKVGTVSNSCSTMHCIHSKPIELSDFSFDNLLDEFKDAVFDVVKECEKVRKKFLETGDKRYWRLLIQLLPSSYNQRRTIMLNYEVLANIYRQRKNHKLDEWHEFCAWIETLPYSEIITLKEKT